MENAQECRPVFWGCVETRFSNSAKQTGASSNIPMFKPFKSSIVGSWRTSAGASLLDRVETKVVPITAMPALHEEARSGYSRG